MGCGVERAAPQDAVDWCERLQSQLTKGAFHYIAVAQPFTAQPFTAPVLRTLRYMNESNAGLAVSRPLSSSGSPSSASCEPGRATHTTFRWCG